MVRTIEIIGYNVVMIELLVIARVSWLYTGHPAIRGSGRFLGPFMLILAGLRLRVDVQMLLVWAGHGPVWGYAWQAVSVIQVLAAMLTGGLLCEHLLRGARRARAMDVARDAPYDEADALARNDPGWSDK